MPTVTPCATTTPAPGSSCSSSGAMPPQLSKLSPQERRLKNGVSPCMFSMIWTWVKHRPGTANWKPERNCFPGGRPDGFASPATHVHRAMAPLQNVTRPVRHALALTLNKLPLEARCRSRPARVTARQVRMRRAWSAATSRPGRPAFSRRVWSDLERRKSAPRGDAPV